MGVIRVVFLAGGLLIGHLAFCQAAPIQAVTFADTSGETFVAIREVATATESNLDFDPEKGGVILNDIPVPQSSFRQLWDGTNLITLSALTRLGAVLNKADDKLTLTLNTHDVVVEVPKKWVEVSLKEQYLRAWQGDRLILRTKISSGRRGYETPLGHFKTGPAKEPMHLSSLYENAPMPFAIQVDGNVFAHGSGEVPRRPASHGCVRMPLNGKNAARYFYNWVDRKVPFAIQADWSDQAKALIEAEPDQPKDLANAKVVAPSAATAHHAPKKKRSPSKKKPQPKPEFYGPYQPVPVIKRPA